MKVIGLYRLPQIKHEFLIVSSLEAFLKGQQELKDYKKRMECIEHILQSKDCTPPKETQQWRAELVLEEDFLRVLKQRMPKVEVSSNLSSHKPICMELLTINLVKTPETSSDLTLSSPKELSVSKNEDIIEVFI